MLMTEEEAKTKTCPLTIGVAPVYHPLDGQCVHDGRTHNCGASECMAWRWGAPSAKPPGPGLSFDEEVAKRGYCGLAGKADER